jgi:hypothetical protein
MRTTKSKQETYSNWRARPNQSKKHIQIGEHDQIQVRNNQILQDRSELYETVTKTKQNQAKINHATKFKQETAPPCIGIAPRDQYVTLLAAVTEQGCAPFTAAAWRRRETT